MTDQPQTTPADATYSVGRLSDGHWGWWPTWTQAGGTAKDVRRATIEEGKLMAKCEWELDTPADRVRLRELLNG